MELNAESFKKSLDEHNLTISKFLDLRDNWNRLNAEDKYKLVREEYEKTNGEK